MIVPDVNLLLYAVITGFPQHRRAHEWWEGVINDSTPVGLTHPAVFGFLRFATNARVLDAPLAVVEAADYVREWLAEPTVELLKPGPRHLDIALGLLEGLGTAGNLTADVQLAAYALECNAEINSNDSDFARFPNVRWTNPLQDQ